jgi:hypothetical protein
MTYSLWIDGAVNVHRDPCGHYHHNTLVHCKLETGVLERGPVLFTAPNGERYTAKLWTGTSIEFPTTIDQLGDRILELVVSWPAIPGISLKDTRAVSCSNDLYQEVIAEMLLRDPGIFLHFQGGNDQDQCTSPCLRCRESLPAIPKDILRKDLELLKNNSIEGIALSAEDMLNQLGK